MSLNICREENTKTFHYFLVDNKPEPWDNSKTSAVFPERKYDHEYFNLMTPSLVSFVASSVVSQLKLLRITWYKCMTPFRHHLHLLIKKYLCPFHNSFSIIDNISNE